MLPVRQRLPHDVPLWVDPTQEIYFVTLNCQPSGQNTLARDDVARRLFESVASVEHAGAWYCYLLMLLPDHLHGLFRFAGSPRPMRSVVSDWKRWTARHLGICWQRNFFEHRLRQDESLRDKAAYILENPVRAGLVARTEDRPFVRFGSQYASILDR